MLRNMYRTALSTRPYSTVSQPGKPSLQLVAQLRKLTEVSITKAREALTATNNDVDAALEWLDQDLAVSGSKKAAKVEGRKTEQGLVSVSVLASGAGPKSGAGLGSVRAAMVELNCETDFVGRNDLFGRLAADIAHTAAYMSDFTAADSSAFHQWNVDQLKDAPMLSQLDPASSPSGTVGSSIRGLIGKVGENVSLRRAVAVVENEPKAQSSIRLRLGTYIHGSINQPTQGRIGALALLALNSPNIATKIASDSFISDLERLERSIARQVVGFDTRAISAPPGDETALYNQPFVMYPESAEQTVQRVLQGWAEEHGMLSGEEEGSSSGVAVLDFVKWTVGEPL